MIVSFDFDGTLEDDFDGTLNTQKEKIQNICKLFCSGGHDVRIITKRYSQEFSSEEYKVVYELANKIGIPIQKVHFTNREYKDSKVFELGIDLHFENSRYEASLISNKSNVIWVEDPNWEETLRKHLVLSSYN